MELPPAHMNSLISYDLFISLNKKNVDEEKVKEEDQSVKSQVKILLDVELRTGRHSTSPCWWAATVATYCPHRPSQLSI